MAAPSPATDASPPLPRLGFLLLAAVTVVWGVSWPIMKTALNELPPLTFRALTVPLGGLVLLFIARFMGQRLSIPPAIRRPMLISTAFNVTLWHLFSAFGIAQMGSGHAALIAYTMPIWAAILGILFFGERMTPRRLAALALGLAGIVFLMPDPGSLMNESLLGIGFMLGAAVSWAAGILYFKRVRWGMQIIPLAGWQNLLGGLPFLPIALAVDHVDLAAVSPAAYGSALYVSLGAIALCTCAWYKVVILFPTRISSIGTLLIPVIGVVSAALSLGEPLGLREVAAMALICGALALELAFRPQQASA